MSTTSKLSADEKYYLCSTAAQPPSQSNSLVLRKGKSDTFVSRLKNRYITLASKPSEERPQAALHPEDELAKWISVFEDPDGSQLSLKLQNGLSDIDQFEISFTGQWKLTFSSSRSALESAFGKVPGSNEDPGLNDGANTLFLGLVLPLDGTSSFTVENAFQFAGLEDIFTNIPESMRKMALSLDSSRGERNALWFKPSYGLETTMRLQFKLGDDAAAALQQQLINLVPNIGLSSPKLIWKKTVGALRYGDGYRPVPTGSVTFYISDFSVAAKSADSGKSVLSAAIEFGEWSITLTLLPKPRSNPFQAVIEWIASFGIGGLDAGSVQNILQSSDAFETDSNNVLVRRVVIGLEYSDEVRPKLRLEKVKVDIEVPSTFGRRDTNAAPVFLLGYTWSRKVGSTIRGEFWPSSLSKDFDVSAYYEEWTHLAPVNPASETIDLENITLAGTRIENIPEFIPTQISNASIMLSSNQLFIQAIVETKKVDSDIPQPYFGQLQLNLSYTWGQNPSLSVRFDFLASLESIGAGDQLPVTFSGYIEYNSGTKAWDMVQA
ncbi:hypothetical protein BDW62DRAFT_187282 [Aspergillus aurantiobrunneus]